MKPLIKEMMSHQLVPAVVSVHISAAQSLGI